MVRVQEDMHGGATRLLRLDQANTGDETEVLSGRHLRILLRGIIGASVSERPNKNRHTIGIDYFHDNPHLNC